MTTKLYRSTTDKKIFGVCGGLGQALNVDSTLLRFIVVVATIFSGGTAGLLYVVAGLVIPEEPIGYIPNYSSHHHGFGMNDKTQAGQAGQNDPWGKDWAQWGKEMGKEWGDWAKDWSKSWNKSGSGCNGHRASNKYKDASDSFANETGYGTQAHAGPHTSGMAGSPGPGQATGTAPQQSNQDELDALMRDVEAKALRKEIEELKQRLAKFEQEKGDH